MFIFPRQGGLGATWMRAPTMHNGEDKCPRWASRQMAAEGAQSLQGPPRWGRCTGPQLRGLVRVFCRSHFCSAIRRSVMDIHEHPINLKTVTGFLWWLNSSLASSGLLGQQRKLARRCTSPLPSVLPSSNSNTGLIFTYCN